MARSTLDRLRALAFYAYFISLVLFAALAVAGYASLRHATHERNVLTHRQCAAISGAEALWRVERKAALAEASDGTVSVPVARAQAAHVHALTRAIRRIHSLRC